VPIFQSFSAEISPHSMRMLRTVLDVLNRCVNNFRYPTKS